MPQQHHAGHLPPLPLSLAQNTQAGSLAQVSRNACRAFCVCRVITSFASDARGAIHARDAMDGDPLHPGAMGPRDRRMTRYERRITLGGARYASTGLALSLRVSPLLA